MGREYVEELKNRVLNGGAEITYDEALKLAHEDLDILADSANEIREHFCGDRCDVCSVISVKEGRCTENCRYCAQSRIAKKDIPEINLLGNEAVTEGASIDYDKGSFRYCLVAEGRRLSKREVELAEKRSRIYTTMWISTYARHLACWIRRTSRSLRVRDYR